MTSHDTLCFAGLTDVRSLVPPRYCYSITKSIMTGPDSCESHWQSKGDSRGARCFWDPAASRCQPGATYWVDDDPGCTTGTIGTR